MADVTLSPPTHTDTHRHTHTHTHTHEWILFYEQLIKRDKLLFAFYACWKMGKSIRGKAFL